ncbi:DEAD/DEAH box helicase family protein [Candidatus Gracilibacteria bacterium]|nr:DEAD/DEAH box helicase family protein [Candidatus Gracilibacteria bacterium]
MDKKQLSERDICSKYINPALQLSDWDLEKQVREEVTFTDGKILIQGKRISRVGKKRADYILYYKNNFPIAVIEAKDNNHSIGAGMQQALHYAKTLDIPFVYSSNGDGFLEHDRTLESGVIERELSLENFPSPQELYNRYLKSKNISEEQKEIIEEPYYLDVSGKEARYYQRVAINRTIEAIAKGQDRILLVMATGTGKTYTAFQIIYRLWKAKAKKRILFLADRNILVDQTMTNDFKPFGDVMTKIKNRQINKAYEVYLALYQAVTGNEEEKNIFKQFSPDFFDLIVIDECHRGSAKEESAWREILEYFSNATQIGLTATPKETKEASNIDYFGEPIYSYTLKEGIEDGFLAPYKVIRIGLDIDEGWRPTTTTLDKNGREIEDRIYNTKDFDRNIVIDDRTKVVAKKITQFLRESGDRFQKTIVFCMDIDHAERMRQALINENADLVQQNDKYIMRITGDNEEGKNELDNFIDPNEKYPSIVTTSKLLTTGVDAKTCKLIVLDQNINSMTEFKQIIGRGTRLKIDSGKYYFTIMDFRKATNNFADPDFDGEPVMIYEPKQNDPIIKDESDESGNTLITPHATDEEILVNPDIDIKDTGDRVRKIYVSGVKVEVAHERVQYLGADGKLITESLKDYSKKNILSEYKTLEDFILSWNKAEKKEIIIEELLEKGVILDELEREVGKDLDPFDLICHIAFDKPALTKKERVENVKKRNYFEKYSLEAREVIEALLEKYAESGIDTIEDIGVLNIGRFREFGSPLEIIKNRFGGKQNYLKVVKEIEERIYETV